MLEQCGCYLIFQPGVQGDKVREIRNESFIKQIGKDQQHTSLMWLFSSVIPKINKETNLEVKVVASRIWTGALNHRPRPTINLHGQSAETQT